MDNRLNTLQSWLQSVIAEPLISLSPASADASFRRYFRARTRTDSYIVMDAPPEHEPLDQFIRIDKALQSQEVHAPDIYDINREQGFMLLEDLGDQTYLQSLHRDSKVLYTKALAALINIQRGNIDHPDFLLPKYDDQLIQQELNLYETWYLGRHKGVTLNRQQLDIWQNTCTQLQASYQQQPEVWVHRDFHSRNLMITAKRSPGVIDFQDMVLGPVSYDLASLFKDCYICWPRSTQLQWLEEYHALAMREITELDFSLQELIEWYDMTGLQRHLKVLGIFCRLNYRDKKSQYMTDLPMVREYIVEALSLHPQLHDFSLLFNEIEELPDA